MASIINKIPFRYLKRRGPRCAKHDGYKKRDEVLFRLGFASYRDYLRSNAWKAIREAKLAIDPQCEICGDKAQQVHHISYRKNTLTGKNPRGLVSVCESCHTKIEKRPDGTKRNFEAAFKTTKRMLKKVGKWEAHTKRGVEK